LNKASIAKLLSSCKAKTDAIYEILRAAEIGKLKKIHEHGRPP
jgi:hypothetical protein